MAFRGDSRVLVLRQNTSVITAAKAMAHEEVGSAMVSDGSGHIVGIVTDRDLAVRTLASGKTGSTPLSEVMTEELVYATEQTELNEILNLMSSHSIRRIPILKISSGKKSHCLEIVTLDDLIVKNLVDIDSAIEVISAQTKPSKPIQNRFEDRKFARKEQTLNVFYRVLSSEMNVDKTVAIDLTFLMLPMLMRRITYEEALDFISALPSLLQDRLLEVKIGPDRRISAHMLIDRVQLHLGIGQEQAEELIRSFWRGLRMFLTGKEPDHVLSQLPKDIQLLLSGSGYRPVSA